MKRVLFEQDLGLGRSAWIELTSYGRILAKADFHPDDPIVTLVIGTPQECFKAIQSVARSIRNNRLGRVQFAKQAPLDYPKTVVDGICAKF